MSELKSEPKKLVHVVCAVLIDADNRILIQQRPAHKIYPGMWEFPGGKIDAGETPEAALVRELKEELDIVTIEKALFPLTFLTGGYPEFDIVNLMFGCRNWTGTPRALEGQPQLAWATIARLGDYDLLEKNREALPVLRELI